MMLFLNTQVPDEILIDRCVGRRLDPETGKIYHLTNFPPETEEIKARLVTRPDDTEEKVWENFIYNLHIGLNLFDHALSFPSDLYSWDLGMILCHVSPYEARQC